MVIGKVHTAVHVPVIFHLWTFGQREAQTTEDVHNLILDDSEGMAGTQGNRVGSAGEVDMHARGLLGDSIALERVDLVRSSILELIELHAYFLFHVGRHVSEVCHQSRNLAFLAKVLDS